MLKKFLLFNGRFDVSPIFPVFKIENPYTKLIELNPVETTEYGELLLTFTVHTPGSGSYKKNS